MTTDTRPIEKLAMRANGVGWLDRYFYFCMSLLIAVVVVYGFSHTVDRKLIHAVPVRPSLLYFHASVFSGWVAFFIFQSALARMHSVRLHRLIGWFGVALGAMIPILGVSTAITMARFNISHFHSTDEASGLIISFFDMTAFAIPFALAIRCRKRTEFHRRLMLVASCALTSAAFARFPPHIVPPGWFYVGVDLLILLGITRDLIINRRIHRVYLYSFPAFVTGQLIAIFTVIYDLPYGVRIGNAILN